MGGSSSPNFEDMRVVLHMSTSVPFVTTFAQIRGHVASCSGPGGGRTIAKWDTRVPVWQA